MPILVSDANIIIDFDVADIARLPFKLSEDFVTSDFVYQNELSEHHSDLPSFGLAVLQLDSDSIGEMIALVASYPIPGTNDLSVLALAKRHGWPLLTGDAHLRKAAVSERVDVHGTLWLMQRMLDERILTADQARKAFTKMRNGARRLPWSEVELRFF